MTRRIALAILFSAWAVVLVALAVVYLTARHTLLAELDESIILRASTLPQLLGVSQQSGETGLPPGDRYVIRNELGQVIVRPDGQVTNRASPVVTNRKFLSLPDGRRLRSLTLNFGVRAADGQPEKLATIVYSAPADAMDNLLWRLTIVLCAVGLGGALLIGAVAMHVSRAALRPLRVTADVIGTIDEKKLDRRLEVASLPSELRPMAERLNEMLARLEREFTQRKQFLADAAHELRTPVAALLTQLEVTLRRPREPQVLANALRASLTEVQLMRRLVDALLEKVRSEHGLLTARVESVDVSGLLEQCSTMADSLGSSKDIKITRKFPTGLWADLHAVAFQSIVTNLLSNAVEYSRPGGSVQIDCSISGDQLKLTVRDDGPGIASQVLPHVFQPFYRADTSRGSDRGHLGLGLFLVQSHAQQMGGRCEVESTLGAGSTFRVCLPLTQSAPAPDSERNTEEKRVLREIASTPRGRVAFDGA
jgi:signal transduction histidine kinase